METYNSIALLDEVLKPMYGREDGCLRGCFKRTRFLLAATGPASAFPNELSNGPRWLWNVAGQRLNAIFGPVLVFRSAALMNMSGL